MLRHSELRSTRVYFISYSIRVFCYFANTFTQNTTSTSPIPHQSLPNWSHSSRNIITSKYVSYNRHLFSYSHLPFVGSIAFARGPAFAIPAISFRPYQPSAASLSPGTCRCFNARSLVATFPTRGTSPRAVNAYLPLPNIFRDTVVVAAVVPADAIILLLIH